MILKKLVVGSLATNCYLVGSEQTKEGFIIDPGDEAKQILKSVSDSELDIKFIVLTHGHIDHIGALAEVKRATGAELCVHSGDSRFIQERPLDSVLGPWSYAGWHLSAGGGGGVYR